MSYIGNKSSGRPSTFRENIPTTYSNKQAAAHHNYSYTTSQQHNSHYDSCMSGGGELEPGSSFSGRGGTEPISNQLLLLHENIIDPLNIPPRKADSLLAFHTKTDDINTPYKPHKHYIRTFQLKTKNLGEGAKGIMNKTDIWKASANNYRNLSPKAALRKMKMTFLNKGVKIINQRANSVLKPKVVKYQRPMKS